MIQRGTITKITHEGQKCYAVITAVHGDAFHVRYFFDGAVLWSVKTKDEIRKPLMLQNSELATYIRQTVGVPFEKHIDTTPTQTLGKSYDGPMGVFEGMYEPEDEGDDE